VLSKPQHSNAATIDLPPNTKNFGVQVDLARAQPAPSTPQPQHPGLNPFAAAVQQLFSPLFLPASAATQPATPVPVRDLVATPRDMVEVATELGKILGQADVNAMLEKMASESVDNVELLRDLSNTEIEQLFAKIGQRKAFKKIFNIA
jgi:hypothetical protein